MSARVGLCVPTLNAGDEWKEWLRAFTHQTVQTEVSLVIDSSSQDNTVTLAQQSGLDVYPIEMASFNHGATRQLAVNKMADVDIVVFLTQDAILSSPDSIRQLLSTFEDTTVGAVCGRQLPRKKADVIEAHARLFNYPENSSINSINDAAKKGLKAAFLSNSFAAYRVSALLDVGGFPASVIFGEDMYVAAKLLEGGYKIGYSADACVYHSHNYSLWQEMKRYFDMGVFHAREPWIRQLLGGVEGEGVKFIVSELKYLWKHAFWRIPESMLRTLLRYTGFRLGLMEGMLPAQLKRFFAMNKGFF